MANNRFFRRGTTKIWWCPVVVTESAPKVTETTAGTQIVNVADMTGFTYSNSPIATPDLDDTFDSQIPGVDAAEDSVLTIYEPKTGTDTIITTLAKGTTGFALIFYRGIAGAAPAIGDKCETWPVTSTGPARIYGMDAVGARWRTTLTANSRPNINATMVA